MRSLPIVEDWAITEKGILEGYITFKEGYKYGEQISRAATMIDTKESKCILEEIGEVILGRPEEIWIAKITSEGKKVGDFDST